MIEHIETRDAAVRPFRIAIPEADLVDLRDRLARTRWPDEIENVAWDYGTDSGYMKEFADYWQHKYDWRTQEAKLNAFAQFSATINGQEIRFIHERGKGPNPTPIILFHGWPDSICRYLKLIPMLTNPAAYGGDPNDSFDVIVPAFYSSDGSKKVARPQMLKQSAERCWRLMTDVLGYPRFAAGGGDGGSPMSQLLAVHHPESIIGLHLTDIGYHTSRANYTDLSEAEQQFLGAVQTASFQESAYAMMLGTKPQTLAFGLNDSPVGWAALVIEKFRSWSDCDGDVEKSLSKDELLTNIMLNWFAGIDPRGYREEWTSPSLKPDQQVDVPVALAHPPKDINPIPPRQFAARNLKNIQRWTVLPHGGHFVAREDPQLMAEDIRAFFHDLNAKN